MGWGSGSNLMDKVQHGLLDKDVSPETRKILYEILIPAMQACDWDTELDCMDYDPVYDETIKELEPDWFTEDDDEDEEL